MGAGEDEKENFFISCQHLTMRVHTETYCYDRGLCIVYSYILIAFLKQDYEQKTYTCHMTQPVPHLLIPL